MNPSTINPIQTKPRNPMYSIKAYTHTHIHTQRARMNLQPTGLCSEPSGIAMSERSPPS